MERSVPQGRWGLAPDQRSGGCRQIAYIHRESFPVRYWECDALGNLGAASYLRWMQDAAFAASAAVGYDWARYRDMGYAWLVRETDIQYLAPLRYGQTAEVRTWVMDFHRLRSRRAYEFASLETGELAARAVTDWVYVNTRSLQPSSIPQEMQGAFLLDGLPDGIPPRERFPAAPEAPGSALTIFRQVEWHDIDMMWHVNNAVYLEYIEEAGTRLAEARGWSSHEMAEKSPRISITRHRIEYRQPARLGDELEIVTWYAAGRHGPVLRHCVIGRKGEDGPLVQAQVHYNRLTPVDGEHTIQKRSQ